MKTDGAKIFSATVSKYSSDTGSLDIIIQNSLKFIQFKRLYDRIFTVRTENIFYRSYHCLRLSNVLSYIYLKTVSEAELLPLNLTED